MKRLIASLLSLLPFRGSAAPTVLTGNAGYYAMHYVSKPMANGEKYDPNRLTMACDHLPLGTRVRVTYTSRAGYTRWIDCTVTDRGPSKQLQRDKNRMFDLSWRAFRALESPSIGVIAVRVEVVK